MRRQCRRLPHADDFSGATAVAYRMMESVPARRHCRGREQISEKAAFQGAEVGLRMLQIQRVFSSQIRDREPFATGWWRRTQSQSNPSPLPNSLLTGKRTGIFLTEQGISTQEQGI